MADQFAVAIEGLEALKSFDEIPKEIVAAARMTINAAARRAHASAGRNMRRQVNFPAGYLTVKMVASRSPNSRQTPILKVSLPAGSDRHHWHVF